MLRPSVLLLPASLAVAHLHASVLYDGSLDTLPSAQGWLYATQPLSGATSTQTLSGGSVTLNSNAQTSEHAGYFLFPVLDRNTGFVVELDAHLVSESHVSNNRAGFSVLLLTSDKTGIELGFWTNKIWAQNVGFTQGEGVAFDTTQLGVRYELSVAGGAYSVAANGSPILTGNLRDYSASGIPPYTSANVLFLGDDTSSASGEVSISRVGLTIVPEPSPLWLLSVGIAALGIARRR